MKLFSTLRGILSSRSNDDIIAAIQDLLGRVEERDSPFLEEDAGLNIRTEEMTFDAQGKYQSPSPFNPCYFEPWPLERLHKYQLDINWDSTPHTLPLSAMLHDFPEFEPNEEPLPGRIFSKRPLNCARDIESYIHCLHCTAP